MTAEIIPFPLISKRPAEVLPTLRDLEIEEALSKDLTVEKATDIISEELLRCLVDLGYPLDEKCGKEICLVIESIRSLMLKYYGFHHCFHPLAEISFEHEDDTGQLVFKNPPIKQVKKRKTPTTKMANSNPSV